MTTTMDKSVQHRSILALPVTMQQPTPKGTWVTAQGLSDLTGALPLGVTQYDGDAGEIVSVTVLGTASVNLEPIATAAVMTGDALCFEAGAFVIKSAADAATTPTTVRGIVLYDAAATGHAEVLLR